MRYKLLINGVDIGEAVKADGVSCSSVSRVSKSITTMDGTLYSREKNKVSMNVSLLDMSDDQLWEYVSNFGTNPATIEFVDFLKHRTVVGVGYVKQPQYSVKKTIGTLTYLTNISLTIEMR